MSEQLDIFSLVKDNPTPPPTTGKVHSFRDCLKRSHDAASLPIWEEIYRAAFPGFDSFIDFPQDGPHQRQGVDRIVFVTTDFGLRQFSVDEKIRFFCHRDWRKHPFSFDVALEYLSNDRTGAPGWVCKPLDCDFIAYAIAPLGEGCLLPVRQLQQAWGKKGNEWRATYPDVVARNKGYCTVSCPVPIRVLFAAIGREFRFCFTPMKEN